MFAFILIYFVNLIGNTFWNQWPLENYGGKTHSISEEEIFSYFYLSLAFHKSVNWKNVHILKMFGDPSLFYSSSTLSFSHPDSYWRGGNVVYLEVQISLSILPN